jgi:phytoene dehydrogenase-like protein
LGAVTDALGSAAARAGAELRTGAEVLDVDGTTVTWREEGGEHALDADWVLLNAAPQGTPAEGSQLKVNMLLDRLPRLRSGVAPEDAFTGTFHLHQSEPELEAAHAKAAAGRLPARPPAELYCHSLTDRSILGADAPPDQQTLTLFATHAPARLFANDHDATRDALVERLLDGLDAHLADPVRDCLARDADGRPCLEAKTPQDLERELGLPGGNIFHGDLDWPWDDAGGWGVETADARVLRCGASARRGGGVSGIGGHNAAMAILFPIHRFAGVRIATAVPPHPES